ncbi:L,D-transpeptidase [Pseudonocardia spinosispora]|uniref:L,D-transpeptidase n=1 Tax=Pseudonocardia spinosispora TaxID=103441 RepID=UPI000685A694|nr:L,D-transpeptidase [Pseudonocardia spinosispora]
MSSRPALTRSVRLVVCGVIAALLAVLAFAGAAFADEADTPAAAEKKELVEGTPCALDTIACVAVKDSLAWLIKEGEVVHGPVKISTGGPGKETPLGSHVVQWKNKNHKSGEFKTPDGQPSPMPYAVFFAEGGIAFHEGKLARQSSGCVRLRMKDAQEFYDFLKLGDKVEVVA